MSTPSSAAGTATVSAPANIAFVKYWGAEDLDVVRPCNPSISMTLERLPQHDHGALRTRRGRSGRYSGSPATTAR